MSASYSSSSSSRQSKSSSGVILPKEEEEHVNTMTWLAMPLCVIYDEKQEESDKDCKNEDSVLDIKASSIRNRVIAPAPSRPPSPVVDDRLRPYFEPNEMETALSTLGLAHFMNRF